MFFINDSRRDTVKCGLYLVWAGALQPPVTGSGRHLVVCLVTYSRGAHPPAAWSRQDPTNPSSGDPSTGVMTLGFRFPFDSHTTRSLSPKVPNLLLHPLPYLQSFLDLFLRPRRPSLDAGPVTQTRIRFCTPPPVPSVKFVPHYTRLNTGSKRGTVWSKRWKHRFHYAGSSSPCRTARGSLLGPTPATLRVPNSQ